MTAGVDDAVHVQVQTVKLCVIRIGQRRVNGHLGDKIFNSCCILFNDFALGTILQGNISFQFLKSLNYSLESC